MLDDTQTLRLSTEELALIDTALQTQEKILGVQARAGGSQAKARLGALHGVQRRVRSLAPKQPRQSLWSRLVRAIQCPRCAQA
ncbi:MAG: hypothetical protein AAGM84_15570 [Pseudomonadota bacterium]